ncbi:MAG: hypothetical protein LQ340_003751 [Diploschistes diacapsis]|nr:MAG: hypothetical protein LQ340_003751 [Diploschistes diacapsis]
MDSSSTSPSSFQGVASNTLDVSDVYLNAYSSYLRCGRCAADLCLTSAIVSRGFTGRWGRAYLVSAALGLSSALESPLSVEQSSLPNTNIHKPVPRQLVTGAHTVSDVSCMFCDSILGWKYVAAEEESQKYKVGKYILETKRVSIATQWEDERLQENSSEAAFGGEEAVEFDSQDEEECEELFAGLWSPITAMRRRQIRKFGRARDR